MSNSASTTESILSSQSESSTEDESSADDETIIKHEETSLARAEKRDEFRPDDVRRKRDRDAEKKQRDSKAKLIATYSKVLDEVAGHPESDDAPPDEVSGSAVGASFWTADEKTALNRAVSQHGQDNLPVLARSVPSKSELEVRAYLLHLQDVSSNRPAGDRMATDLLPAAIEIPRSCHRALNRIAKTYSDHVYAQDIDREMEEYGDLWIIDDDYLAARLSSDAEDESAEDTPSEAASAFQLLDPVAFLKLSNDLFMNGSPDTSNNWRTTGETDLASSTPALFRSAFEDFHQTTINLTRTILQQSLIQAQSRLHAKDDERSSRKVTRKDVQLAFQFLYPKIDRKRYWATVARGCGVAVYSRSKRREGGNKGKIGVRLTYDEVEAALGHPPSHPLDGDERKPTAAAPAKLDAHTSDDMETQISEDEGTDSSIPPKSSESNDDDSDSKEGKETESSNSESDNDDDLEILDQRASAAEDKRLRNLLDIPFPGDEDAEEMRPLAHRPRKHRASNAMGEWRKRVKYEAEWERQGL